MQFYPLGTFRSVLALGKTWTGTHSIGFQHHFIFKPVFNQLTLDTEIGAYLIGMVYPIVTQKMLEVYIPEKMYTTIVIAGVIVLALYVIRMLLRYFVQYYGHIIGVRMQSKMRQDLFDHLEKLPFKFYDDNETGRIMTRITSDLFEVCELAHHNILHRIIQILIGDKW